MRSLTNNRGFEFTDPRAVLSAARRILILSLGLVLGSCATETPDGSRTSVGPPEIFAPGVISTEAPEFAASFTPDGKTVYFNRATADRSRLAIMRSHQIGGEWQEPDTASFSGTWLDVDPFVAPDGTRLYFSSSRPTDPEDGVMNFNTWVVLLSTEGEDEPALLPAPVNSDSTEVFVSAATSGALYFSSNRDGVMRTYRASSAGTDAEVTVVPIDMNLANGVGNPAVSQDEKYLVYVARTDSGFGGADLFISSRTLDGWSPGRILPEPINSAFTDFAPSWSPDGSYLYFTSERPGLSGPVDAGSRPPGDLYRVAIEAIPSSR